MKHPRLTICYHPTTILLVDDNKDFLQQFKLRFIEREKLACITYDDPQQALTFLTKEYGASPFINRCLLSEEEGPINHLVIDLDVRAVHHEVYNPRRFAEITVLVIDYAMPGLNGLELCRLLKDASIKIIMLTGEAGKDLAVQAFNEGLINKFIMKNTPNLMEVLMENLHELQMSYFLDLADVALNKVASFPKHSLACLEDPVFYQFFHELCRTNDIVEYYLIDSHGSFLMLTAPGKMSWLAVANEEQMLSYYHLADDDNAPDAIMQSLASRRMLPYFHNEKGFNTRPSQWQEYLYPAQVLVGKQTYYYAYIKELHEPEIARHKIVSYQEFLKTRIPSPVHS